MEKQEERKARAADIRKRILEKANDEGVDFSSTDDDDELPLHVRFQDRSGIMAPEIREYTKRVDSWKLIGEHAATLGIKSAYDEYNSMFPGKSQSYIEKVLGRWARDYKKKKDTVNEPKNHAPVCGYAADQMMKDKVLEHRAAGLCVDNNTLDHIIMEVLKETNQSHLYKKNGGQHAFDDSWKQRFWKRHNLPMRIATTKVRILPENHEVLIEKYITIGSQIICEHRIPPTLVCGFDETMIQVVSGGKKTRSEKGEKRVRTQHNGNEKALSTTGTIFCVPETPLSFGHEGKGDILDMQVIMEGKTDRCHPNQGKGVTPEGLVYMHTASNWQTPESMMNCVKTILSPWRKRVIAALRAEGKNIPDDQKALLIPDLHYSHIAPEVLECYEKYHFKTLNIPPKMTDEVQVGDTRLNKTFKGAFNAEFNRWADELFAKWKEEHPDELVGAFRLQYQSSVLKPLLPRFILAGVAALKTPAMRASITAGFQEEGRLREMYSEERQNAAAAFLMQQQEEKQAADAAAAAELAAQQAAAAELAAQHAAAAELAAQQVVRQSGRIGAGVNNKYD